jgi:solute carrier family 25 citrate transporter 1
LTSSAGDFLSGVGAGVIEAIFAVTPMESIKTITIEHHLGLISGIKHIWREYGIRGFYKGTVATILKQSSNQVRIFVALFSKTPL